MRHAARTICLLLMLWVSVCRAEQVPLQRIINDIFTQLAEDGEADWEEVQTDLQEIAANPIDLNRATAADLQQLRFLSDQQIDAILLYVYEHPMQELTELQLIPCLATYDIRNLCAFATVCPVSKQDSLNLREVFRNAKHEVVLRVDARNPEDAQPLNPDSKTTDPMFVQARYRFRYHQQVQFGATLRRPAGGNAADMTYGAYLQLKDIGHLRTLVAGNFQAAFGQGLVFAQPFHMGRSAYVMTAGNATEGLRRYSSTDDGGLHGVGATVQWRQGQTRFDLSALYSMQRANDSTWRHVVGGNFTLRHKQFKLGITLAENIYSDTLRLFRNTGYNAHYFRGIRQAVLGVNARYNFGRYDLFGELATAQNSRWGVGLELGCRMTPVNGIGLIALYRYYSPFFDNTLGYAFSETSRINDEQGGYIGLDISRLRRWHLAFYVDVFRFSGVKYGIPFAPSWGYEAMGEATYMPAPAHQLTLRLRAREKGRKGLYSGRLRYTWTRGGWDLQTQADCNLASDTTGTLTWGASILQDINYAFRQAPVSIGGRIQLFDARNYANRIYSYEQDVLYAYSSPFVYGQGVRLFLNLRWQAASMLTFYLRASETIYSKNTASLRHIAQTRTDIHLLARLSL